MSILLIFSNHKGEQLAENKCLDLKNILPNIIHNVITKDENE